MEKSLIVTIMIYFNANTPIINTPKHFYFTIKEQQKKVETYQLDCCRLIFFQFRWSHYLTDSFTSPGCTKEEISEKAPRYSVVVVSVE